MILIHEAQSSAIVTPELAFAGCARCPGRCRHARFHELSGGGGSWQRPAKPLHHQVGLEYRTGWFESRCIFSYQ